ncbi:Transcriptional activator NphR [Paenibacillus konkukensis]|uniref:Transcriptional activator NphR n=1 Tax=Paenibacillus konkukensis TaxID=2020716 RepID=A0ABY4RIL3_9BACL|nr:helix-turn-helix domain-containing protein [Paenibacillus konkukensis]UQZ82242.1 Transcriptional activator NphR [Paenibacillus konkukensis]
MRMSWYHRILLSYAPIFFLVVSVLIFSFFAVLSNSAKDQIALTDEAIATKVMQVIDSSLKATERMLIKEMDVNDSMAAFFRNDASKIAFDYFLISRKVDEFSSMLPLSNSIYLYNEKSGQVLSHNGLSSLDQFGDREFLVEAYRSGTYTSGWTNPREFKEFSHEAGGERVVTLFKYYPVTGDRQGAVVINIRVPSLVSFIKDLTRYDAGLIQLFAGNGEPFDKNQGSPAVRPSGQEQLKHAVSDYTSWYYISNARSDKQLSFLSLLHNFWIILGLAAVAAGIGWFTYVTHRNFKPIQAIAGRIQDYTKRRSGELVRHPAKDELKFIEAAIDGLLERSSQFEQLYKDDLPIRRRQRLSEWLEGGTMMSEARWKQEMAKLQLPSDFARLMAAVMEIDRHSQFANGYSPKDQYLLKFAVSQVLQEIASDHLLVLWNEWLEPHQMAVVFYLDHQESARSQAIEAMRRLQAWVSDNLEFTVSVGIGSDTSFYADLPGSYEEAREQLCHKPLFGTNCMLGKESIRSKREGGIFPHLQLVSAIARSFRQDDGHWQAHVNKLAIVLQNGIFSQADLHHVMDYLLYQIQKELDEMPEEVHDLFKRDYLPQLEAVADSSRTLNEWRDELCRLLLELEAQIREVRAVRNNDLLVCRVKQYIELNYADPELSLGKLSEYFELNPRYLSKLFKEEAGEKFIDYMLKVRLEEASRLLLATELSVQEIAERVGYLHVISFHRAFKNMFGLPPGDYRKKSDGVRRAGE